MQNIVTHKICSKCKKRLSIDSFIPRGGNRSGEYSSYCRLCNKQIAKQYKTQHPNKGKEYMDRWKLKNPGLYESLQSSWRKTNKNKTVEYAERRRALKNNENGNFSQDDWTFLLNKYGNKCLCCGSSFCLTQDHIIPLSRGGKHSIENIQPLCKICNSKKHTKIIDYRPDFI